MFGFLNGPQPEIQINILGERGLHKRIVRPGSRDSIEASESCPILHPGDVLKGQLLIRLKQGQASFEHQGVSLEFIGALELPIERGNHIEILRVRKQLLTASESPLTNETTLIDFDFGPHTLPYPSYDGLGFSLRYIKTITFHMIDMLCGSRYREDLRTLSKSKLCGPSMKRMSTRSLRQRLPL